MHWVYFEGPAEYRAAIAAHFTDRTAGEAITPLSSVYKKIIGLKDDWYDPYAGRIYPGVKYGDQGLEIPSRYIEWLAMAPADMADYWNSSSFRETLLIVLQPLF